MFKTQTTRRSMLTAIASLLIVFIPIASANAKGGGGRSAPIELVVRL